MSSVETLISMHREDMAHLRSESRQAKKGRLSSEREMDQAFRELRSKVAAEMPVTSSSIIKFRGPIAFMTTLLGVLSF